MAIVNREILIPYMDAYKKYLDAQERGADTRPLSNVQEDYKRGIATKAAEILNQEAWSADEIGGGTISGYAIKAVQRNLNLVGRFQVSAFSEKVKEDYYVSEQLLFDLYHERKDQECFERICSVFGRKYDLVAYLYFILDPGTYLPLRSSIFDGIFSKLRINLQTTARCAWDNYQEFLSTIGAVRDMMKDYYQVEDVDLLDAHSFLWTINMDVLGKSGEQVGVVPKKQKEVESGTAVMHKDYGKGIILKLTENRVYVDFGGRQRIFLNPECFEKKYLRLL